MEKKPIFNKYNIISFLLILVIVAVVIITKISINKVKEDELGKFPEDNLIVEDIPEDIVEDIGPAPDVTWQEYNNAIYEIDSNNYGRYDFDYIEKLIKENVKYDEELINIDFIQDASIVEGGFKTSYFKEYNGIWYPDQGFAIVIARINKESSDEFVKSLREFTENQSKKLQGTGLSYLYNDYQHTVTNGYHIYVVCDNAQVVMKKIINYINVEDELAIREYTDKYYTNEYGAFLKETEIDIENTTENTENNIEDIQAQGEAYYNIETGEGTDGRVGFESNEEKEVESTEE